MPNSVKQNKSILYQTEDNSHSAKHKIIHTLLYMIQCKLCKRNKKQNSTLCQRGDNSNSAR